MALSAYGLIRDDCVSLIGAIVPTVKPELKWRLLEDSRSDMGRGERMYMFGEVEPSDPSVFGAGERQEHFEVPIEVTYTARPDLHDMLAGDLYDLIQALQPSRTYPSGNTWSLKVRRIGNLEGPTIDDDDDSVRTVTYPLVLIFRYQVTLI